MIENDKQSFVDLPMACFKCIPRIADTSKLLSTDNTMYLSSIWVLGHNLNVPIVVWLNCYKDNSSCVGDFVRLVRFLVRSRSFYAAELSLNKSNVVVETSHVQKQHSRIFHHRFDLA